MTRVHKRTTDVVARLAHYKHIDSDTLPMRAAHFLDYAAKEVPGVPIAWNVILKYIMGFSRMPQPNNADAIALSEKGGAIRKKLMEKFNRGLHVARGQGVRATTDDDDLANTQFRGNMNRLASAKRSAEATRELIDPNAMRNKELKSWVVQGATPALKSLDALARLDKLLPPAGGTK